MTDPARPAKSRAPKRAHARPHPTTAHRLPIPSHLVTRLNTLAGRHSCDLVTLLYAAVLLLEAADRLRTPTPPDLDLSITVLSPTNGTSRPPKNDPTS